MAQTVLIASICFAAAAAASWFLTRLLLPRLKAWGRIDRPNQRSSHASAVPRGGGLALVGVLSVALALSMWRVGGGNGISLALVCAAFVGLAALSWRDDRESLPASLRLLAQIVAVAMGLSAIPSTGLAFHGYLPPFAENLVIGLAWLWFVNLYNFMDGIDGIAGVETTSIGIGLVVVFALIGTVTPFSALAAAMAGAACGFLFWNWSPAKLFMGDVGSVPLGFLAGFLLVYVAKEGHIVPALILPMYYLVDATATLLIRIARREPVWEAHRSHAYQIAAAATSHPAVVKKVAALNLALIVLAAIAARYAGEPMAAIACLGVAFATAVALYLRLRSSGGVSH